MDIILVISNKLNSLIENSLTFSSKCKGMKFLKLLVIVILFSTCNDSESKFIIDDSYIYEIDTFFEAKMEERQGDYLQLVALYRLNDGSNTFGQALNNNLILKIELLPETIGSVLCDARSHHAQSARGGLGNAISQRSVLSRRWTKTDR